MDIHLLELGSGRSKQITNSLEGDFLPVWSQDGKNISYMKPWKEGNRMMNVYIKSVDSDKEVRITNASERSLYGYFWVSDSRIAYIQDKGGDENYQLFGVNIDGSNTTDLTPYDNVKVMILNELKEQKDFIADSIRFVCVESAQSTETISVIFTKIQILNLGHLAPP